MFLHKSTNTNLLTAMQNHLLSLITAESLKDEFQGYEKHLEILGINIHAYADLLTPYQDKGLDLTDPKTLNKIALGMVQQLDEQWNPKKPKLHHHHKANKDA